MKADHMGKLINFAIPGESLLICPCIYGYTYMQKNGKEKKWVTPLKFR